MYIIKKKRCPEIIYVYTVTDVIRLINSFEVLSNNIYFESPGGGGRTVKGKIIFGNFVISIVPIHLYTGIYCTICTSFFCKKIRRGISKNFKLFSREKYVLSCLYLSLCKLYSFFY